MATLHKVILSSKDTNSKIKKELDCLTEHIEACFEISERLEQIIRHLKPTDGVYGFEQTCKFNFAKEDLLAFTFDLGECLRSGNLYKSESLKDLIIKPKKQKAASTAFSRPSEKIIKER